MKHIVVLTGAGISAQSGVKTFRDHDGLWEGHDIMEVASPQGFKKNPKLVLDFYNARRRQLKTVEPNHAHRDLVALEMKYKVTVITQNVDDLHERAGSSDILHLHGELLKMRSTGYPNDVQQCTEAIHLGDVCKNGYQLRPHIVWFGEEVPEIDTAMKICYAADVLIIIGTSLQVYPAASLINYVQPNTQIYYIDPNPAQVELPNITIIPKSATDGMAELLRRLL